MAEALADGEGRLRGDIARAAVLAVLGGRRLMPEDRAQMRKGLAKWRAAQAEEAKNAGSQMLAVSSSPAHEAWTRIYHALYNSAEFRFRN